MTILSADFIADAAIPAATGADQTMLPDEARLYLRHVQNGESIRAIARETGCHPSTILRRIRRFEQRRDDPLVDGAVDRVEEAPAGAPAAPAGAASWSRHDRAQARRILRRLAEPGAELVVADGMDKAIVSRDEVRTAILDRQLAEKFALRGWVVLKKAGRLSRHVISASGRAALKAMTMRRSGVPGLGDFLDAEPVSPDAAPDLAPGLAPGLAEAAAPFDAADRHRVWGEREIEDPEDGERRRARVNLAESPVTLLARRRDAAGRPFLEPEMVAAADRLREDFELAQMGPRVTQNWDRFLTSGCDMGAGRGHFGGSDSARDRVAAALRELGPGMGDLVLRVCCFLEGIEMTERRLGWPSRSAKIVLRLALMRLDRHYRDTYGAGSRLIG